MGSNTVQKILEKHVVSGELKPGKEVGIRIDQTLTQDATGTMAYLQFEAMGIPRVKTKLSVSYVDHNTLQSGYENFDDHLYLKTAADKYGIYFSKPGNGICHQVHLERFGVPGMILLGSDSHTPTAGGLGMIAIGVGGLDAAVAMAGGPFYMSTPRVVLVRLTGALSPWVSAKDVILEVLKRLSVKGGVGKIMEYGGPGVKTLTVPERATITNMGAELGATTSIFPSDEQTRIFLEAQGRGESWQPIEADPDAYYDEIVEIDLSQLEPLIACPHSPDNVKPVTELEGLPVHQVCIGSCTNSSFKDLMVLANTLEGKKIHPDVSMTVSPGSKQVLTMISKNGGLTNIILAGARLIECACGPCIGMGQSPPSKGVSVRTFNRNFEGRSGTKDAEVYLASTETAIACALNGVITDPRKLGSQVVVSLPEKFFIDDSLVLPPSGEPEKIQVRRGPNIKPLPKKSTLENTLNGKVLLKVEDNITTDHIMPAGAKILPLRSNIPAISQHVFAAIDPEFSSRAKSENGGFIVGGENYGQGSSREHAALAPMYLGLKAVLTKSFARIHRANLINFGILPLEFADTTDYHKIEQGDQLEIPNLHNLLKENKPILVKNITQSTELWVKANLSGRQAEIILAGGLLNYTKLHA